MATTSSKVYPSAFTANAFLIPKHAKPDDLFVIASDDIALKKLKPSAETVKEAILECKKQGLQATFSSGLALPISGEASVLYECFAVRLAYDDSVASEKEWFEDETGKKKDQPTPLPGHPLARYIVSLSADPGPDFNLPKYPGKTKAWAKKEKYHIWPHELQRRLSVNTKSLSLADEKEFEDNIQNGNSFCISLVDTGLYGNHPYFKFRDFNLPNTIDNPKFPMYWPEVKELTTGNTELKQNALTTNNELTALIDYSNSIIEALWDKYFIYQDPTSNVILRPQMLADSGLDIFRSEITGVRISRFYKDYVASNAKLTKPLVNLLDKVSKYLQNPTGSTWSGSKLDWVNLRQQFVYLKEHIEEKQEKLHDALRWIENHGQKNVDYAGHGTGMAASMLGISKKAHIASFPALAQNSAKIYEEVIGKPPVSLYTIFQAAVDWSKPKDIAVKAKIKLKLPFDPKEPVEFKVISNSYSNPIAIKNLKIADLNNWHKKIEEWVKDDNFSILFSAGNSRNPADGYVSLYALLGDYGAIIVGGAWDYDRTRQANHKIMLSTAAHGLNVKLSTGILSSKTISIPDICGFVGDDLLPPTGNPPGTISPYVYIPTTPGDSWNYYGGGTSSACAQVAALCGALRAKYPNHSALQIKQAIMKGGDLVTEGQSYQEYLPVRKGTAQQKVLKDQPRLANILGAYSEAGKMKPKSS